MIPFMGETVCRAFNLVFIPVFLLLLILKLDILSINSNEFFIDKLLEFIKGVNIFAINLERLYRGELIKETIGRRDQSGL